MIYEIKVTGVANSKWILLDVLHGGVYTAPRNRPERVSGQPRRKHQRKRYRHVEHVPRHGAHGEEVGRQHRHQNRLEHHVGVVARGREVKGEERAEQQSEDALYRFPGQDVAQEMVRN